MHSSLYANSYWSPDYTSGINKLARQLRLSLGQLHELRDYIVNHVKLHHNDGDVLEDSAQRAYAMDSSFRLSRGQRQISGLRKVSGRNSHEEVVALDMDQVFRQFTVQTTIQLQHHRETAAKIEAQVLEPLTLFIKEQEPRVRISIDSLSKEAADYETLYKALEATKNDYNAILRMGEFQKNTLPELEESRVSDTSTIAEVSTAAELEVSMGSYDKDVDSILENQDICMPLLLGGLVRFEEAADFVDFLSTLVPSVPVVRRKIPLPGYSDETFSSESLSDALKKQKIKGLLPSRASVERFCQSLVDLKIIIGTGFFAKRFKTEGMWFEWSSITRELLNAEETNLSIQDDRSFQPTKAKLDEAFSSMAISTTKTFNGVFKSVASTLNKSKFSEEGLHDAELAYNEAYDALQLQKHKLELQIFERLTQLETFEKLKIDVVFRSLQSLQKIQVQHSEALKNLSDSFSKIISSDYDFQSILRHEFKKSFDNFTSGIYFPSLVSPDPAAAGSANVSVMNTNFQNIKLNFNLYKDIPLQLKVSDVKPDVDIAEQSVPLFLHSVVKFLNSFPKKQLHEAWLLPIKHQDVWLVKDGIISVAQEYSKTASLKASDEHMADQVIVEGIVEKIETLNPERLVNFFKQWLLEVSDSMIPSTVYDSLLKYYKMLKSANDTELLADLSKILGAIPRSNLSSLLYILHHVWDVFDLDTANEETKSEVIHKLNLMDVIAAVPFVHLIFRPSVLKHSSGLKPPLDIYNQILSDLLNPVMRLNLKEHLVASEKLFAQRREQQRKLFDQQINGARVRSTSVNSTDNSVPSVDVTFLTPKKSSGAATVALVPPKTPKTLGDPESFSLRPFRTGTTPRPSPSSSPVHMAGNFKEPSTVKSPFSEE